MQVGKALVAAAERSSAHFILTHNYTGYPVVRQARAMIAEEMLGKIRVVQVEYAQDWLTLPLEHEGSKQAEWRTDPARSGAGGCVGDIGTHAYYLAGFVSGLPLESLAADRSSFVEGRRLDDNVHVMLRFTGGAKGMLWSSQVAPGNENALKLRVYGEKGSLEWSQEDPNHLWFTPFGEPKRLLTRNGAGSNAANQTASRIPPSHPERYLEGFANIYNDAADLIEGKTTDRILPTVQDGLAGVAFIGACVRSSANYAAWTKL